MIIEAYNLTKNFSSHRALDDVSICVPEGKIYGLLGPNGAGKTTLIRILNHITAPDSGTVMFDGHLLTAEDVRQIGYLPEERGLYKKMKVGEQAIFFARLKGLSRNEAERELRKWFEKLDISSWWGRPVEELSKGMAQKVQFIITVLHKPKLLIFDEPFSGFDPINAGILKREILELKQQGSSIIFSTHNMGSVEELCDEITLINRSKNILSGRLDDIRSHFAQNRFTFSFSGDQASFSAAAFPLVKSITMAQPDITGRTTAIVTLKDNDALQPLISAVNGTSRLHSFSPLLPSMDDIFVAAVEDYNSKHSALTN